MSVRAMVTKVAWVRDPGVPAGQPADGSYTCPCGAVTGGQPFGGPEWVCSCGRRYDGRGWLLEGLPRPGPDTVRHAVAGPTCTGKCERCGRADYDGIHLP